MRPKVVAYSDCDLVHTSYVFAGLIDLANMGLIDLRFRIPRWSWTRYRGRFTVWLRVDNPHKAVYRYGCVDLHDVNTYFAPESLAKCDLYFKSNYSTEAVNALPETHRVKVRPLGPYYACRSAYDRALLIRHLGSILSLANWLRLCRPTITRVNAYRLYSGIFWRLSRYKGRLTVAEYESDHRTDSAQPTIYFNPSCWPERDDSTREINRLRAEVIRSLRSEFGPRFLGRFIQSRQAEALYPDCVSDVSYDHQAYVRTIQSSLICIYTNGLNGCLSWKLGEYMASAKCIVSEPLYNQLAVPLVDGQDIFFFRSAAECVGIVHGLLDNPEVSLEARRRIAEYYTAYVRPSVSMWHVIESLLSENRD